MKNDKIEYTASICNQRGISLVEVITVLVIVAIAGAFVAPEVLNWRENTRVTSAARDLLADLNSAKVAAIDNNARIGVLLDTGANSYTIFVDDGGTGGVANNSTLDVDADDELLETRLSSKNFNNDNYSGAIIDSTTYTSAAPLVFTPRGLPLNGTNGEILIRNNSDSSIWYKIVVSSSGGLTMLKSLDGGATGTWK